MIARRHNPAIKELAKGQPAAAVVSSVGVAAMIGLGISLAFSGPGAVLAAAVLIAIGTTTIAASTLIAFGGSLVGLVKEFRTKEPKDTYKLRVAKAGLQSAKLALSSAFYISVTILAVLAVVALVSNPVTLPILAAGMFTFALVTGAVSLVSLLLTKLASFHIGKIEKQRRQTASQNKLENSVDNDLEKNNGPKAKQRQNRDSELSYGSKKSTTGLQLLREIAKHKPNITAHSTVPLTQESYQAITQQSLEELKVKKKTSSVYEGIKVEPHHPHKNGAEALLIEIPHQYEKNAHHDKLLRLQNDKNEVEITLTTDPRSHDPSDNAIYILLDLNKNFAPLVMEHCGNPQIVLKIFEAAKLANMELVLDIQDREQLAANSDPTLRNYFNAIEGWTSEEFSLYIKQRAASDKEWKLGKIPRELPAKPWVDHIIDHP